MKTCRTRCLEEILYSVGHLQKPVGHKLLQVFNKYELLLRNVSPIVNNSRIYVTSYQKS